MMQAAALLLLTVAQFPTDKVNSDFSCTSVQACNGTFPGCPPPAPNSTFSQHSVFEAWSTSSSRLARRLGPVSTLPLTLNQKVVYDSTRGTAYYMFIDVSKEKEKIINCTRQAYPKLTAKQLRETLLGSSYQSLANGSAPCSESSSRMGTCTKWQWVSHFGCGVAGQPPKMGREPEAWLLARSSSAAHGIDEDKEGGILILASMTNHIIYPDAGPACHNGSHTFALVDYTKDYHANPDESVFEVPSDAQCPESATTPSNVHPALLRYG